MGAVYAVILTGSWGQGEGPRRPHVVLGVQTVLQGLSTKYTGLFLVKVGYLQARSDEPQLWHSDLWLELPLVWVVSCSLLVNPDCPMDGRENMFVCASGSSFPYPCQECSVSMLAGDLWILSSYVIHHGGATPREARARSTRIIAFAVIAIRRVDYETTLPVIPPPWAEAPAQQPSPPSPKAEHCTSGPVQPLGEGRAAAEVFRL